MDGGGSSIRRVAASRGFNRPGATGTKGVALACAIAQSGQTRQSGECAGPWSGRPPESSSPWHSASAPAKVVSGSSRGTVAPAPSCAISASSTANRPDRWNRGRVIIRRITADDGGMESPAFRLLRRAIQVLLQPRHQFHQVAGPVTIVQLRHQDVVPSVFHRPGAARQREQIGPPGNTADGA